ncbi:putative pterin 4 alpha carbinolamine dehydratase [Acrodontium crateriforme]|uniref:4a-hydroxytetrahydrobiopterin dehydratase n=1 Tax=Acrodontium crateriforme TaxID=150365 RepID=A0AAQ3M628_9PEZI|nr:putative pterin 4 alpha carbinolamine dehydratase [Acrodontium crateriforme]
MAFKFGRAPRIARQLIKPCYTPTQTRKMSSLKDLKISQGHDGQAVTEAATALVESGKWQVCKQGKGLERTFKFKTFKATWDFMNAVADECKKQRHHPEWTNIYNKTHVRWTTHNPEGLSSLDTTMASFCDAAGEKFGVLLTEPAEANVKSGEPLKAGDCCIKKSL